MEDAKSLGREVSQNFIPVKILTPEEVTAKEEIETLLTQTWWNENTTTQNQIDLAQRKGKTIQNSS